MTRVEGACEAPRRPWRCREFDCEGEDHALSERTDIAALLIDVEAALRRLRLWDDEEPSAEALASTQPFAIDTLTFPQWLQFIFLPTMYRLLEQQAPLPERCGIAPMADEYFRNSALAGGDLVAALEGLDVLLSSGDPEYSPRATS